MKMNAKTYRIPTTTTPEDLEMKMMHGGGAIYRFTTDDHTCEGEIELVSISKDTFEDNGHAIAWAMAN